MNQRVKTYHPHRSDHGYYQSWRQIQNRKRKRIAPIWYFLLALAILAAWMVWGSGLFAVTAVAG